MMDWTDDAMQAAWQAMFETPYDGTGAVMVGAGLDAAAKAQGIDAELCDLRERLKLERRQAEKYAALSDKRGKMIEELSAGINRLRDKIAEGEQ